MSHRSFTAVSTLAACLMFATAAPLVAETYHVDPDWDGATRGTADAPFNALGQAYEAYMKGQGHTVKVAAGLYKSTRAGGREEFGETGYDLGETPGHWRGGYVGWDGRAFNWNEADRTRPERDADPEKIDPKTMTVIDLTDANARAFHLSGYSVGASFDGLVFRNSNVTRENYSGGALHLGGGMSGASAHHCLFYNNRTTGEGGGLRLSGRGGTSTNCTFVNNRAGHGGGASINPGNRDQTIRGFVFRNNRATHHGGGLYVPGYSVDVIDSHFEGNQAGGMGGAASANGRIGFKQSRFIANRAANGGAVGYQAHSGGQFAFENCLIVRNVTTGDEGFTIFSGSSHSGGTVELRFTTLARNRAPRGLVGAQTGLTAINNILVGDGEGIGFLANHSASLSHNLVQNCKTPFAGNAKPGEGSVTQAPRFRDAESDDYRPEMDGPAINVATDIGVEVDLAGNRRPYSEKDFGIDLGCFEVAPVPRDTILLLR